MNADIYEGDPLLNISIEGAEIVFSGAIGQPVMDQGIENFAMLSLFSPSFWEGNFYAKTTDERLESDYEDIAKLPTTVSNLELMRQETIKRLSNSVFGDIESTINARLSNQKINNIVISPPSREPLKLQLIQNGTNWIKQAEK